MVWAVLAVAALAAGMVARHIHLMSQVITKQRALIAEQEETIKNLRRVNELERGRHA